MKNTRTRQPIPLNKNTVVQDELLLNKIELNLLLVTNLFNYRRY